VAAALCHRPAERRARHSFAVHVANDNREARELAASLEGEIPELRGDGWQRLLVANVGAEFPIELTTFNPTTPTLDGASHPEGKRLGRVLARWHDAKIQLENSWEMVHHRPPPGMSPPPFPR
jgi:hypothetical protein